MEVRVLKRSIRLFDPSIHVMVPVFGCGPQWLKDSPVVWLMGPLVHGVLESPFAGATLRLKLCGCPLLCSGYGGLGGKISLRSEHVRIYYTLPAHMFALKVLSVPKNLSGKSKY